MEPRKRKTGRDYAVPMNVDVRAVMPALRREAKAGAEHVFTNPKTGMTYVDVKKAFAWACDKAGIRGLRWHDLRHTFGTRLGEAGCSEATISELMGHSSVSTTRRYTHGTEQAKRLAVEAARTRGETAYPISAPKGEQPAARLAVSR